jgi:NAD(P)-dependent dehydrogenase (short-subunit alcohol dehydrogenase family)
VEPEPKQWNVLVTGGASGLGAAVVRQLQGLGSTAIVLDRAQPAGDGPHVVCDLAQTEQAVEAVDQVIDRYGPLDALVTCAGIDHPGRIDKVPASEWEQVIAVNLLGTAAVVRAALPSLRAAHGRIVTVASTLGHRAVSDATAYCASKFGVVGLTRALMVELRDEVGVTLVTPGGMATPFFDGRTEQYRPPADARLADAHDIADAVVFALTRPEGVEVRELVVAGPVEDTWP